VLVVCIKIFIVITVFIDDPEQPKILNDNVAIPECVLNGPTVTGSQKLVFYSSDEGVEPIVCIISSLKCSIVLHWEQIIVEVGV